MSEGETTHQSGNMEDTQVPIHINQCANIRHVMGKIRGAVLRQDGL